MVKNCPIELSDDCEKYNNRLMTHVPVTSRISSEVEATDVQRYMCDICGSTFGMASELELHRRLPVNRQCILINHGYSLPSRSQIMHEKT